MKPTRRRRRRRAEETPVPWWEVRPGPAPTGGAHAVRRGPVPRLSVFALLAAVGADAAIAAGVVAASVISAGWPRGGFAGPSAMGAAGAAGAADFSLAATLLVGSLGVAVAGVPLAVLAWARRQTALETLAVIAAVGYCLAYLAYVVT